MNAKTDLSAFLTKYENLCLLSLVLVVVVIYAHTLDGPFVFDDRPNIVSNLHIRMSEFSFKNLADAAFKSPANQRPLSNISFALNYYLHGYNRTGFHLVNILIHIGSGIFLYIFVKTTLGTPNIRLDADQRLWIAFFTAAIWMVHPLQTQSISYVVQRMNSMAAMFYVLSMLLYARFRLCERRKQKCSLLAGCIIAALLALASKQIAATLPFVILAYELYFFRQARSKIYIASLIGCFLLTIVTVLILLGGDPIDRILMGYERREFTLIQRLLTQPRVVLFYLSLLIWPSPSRLNLDHDFALSHSLMDPISTVLAILALAVMILIAAITAKKQPLVSFGIVWFFTNLVIESSIIPLEIIFEHRTYLPSMMLILTMVSVAFKVIRPKWLCVALLSILTAAGSIGTYTRNQVWTSAVTIWQDSALKSPQKARPYNNLGVALASVGRVNEAYQMYRRSLQIKPDYATAHYNLGYTLAKNDHFKEGLVHLNESLRLEPNNKDTLNDIGVVMVMQGRLNEAVDHFKEVLRLNPTYSRAHNNLGIALGRQNNLTEAIYHYQEALRLYPDYAEAHNNLGLALQRQGKFEAAHHHFDKARRIDPGYSAAHKNYKDNQKNLK